MAVAFAAIAMPFGVPANLEAGPQSLSEREGPATNQPRRIPLN